MGLQFSVSRPLVSIIVPTRNRPELLPRALRSIAAQSHRPLEVIVVDTSGGVIRTAEAQAQEALSSIDGVSLQYTHQPGLQTAGAARNAGLELASGEWTCFLDDDDEYRPDNVEQRLARAGEASAPIVVSALTYVLPGGRERHRFQSRSEYSGWSQLLLELEVTTQIIMHRQCPVRFDPSLETAEDLEYFLRLLTHFETTGLPNVTVPLVTIFRHDQGRLTHQASNHFAGFRRVYLRHIRHLPEPVRSHYLHRLQVIKFRYRPLHRHFFGAAWRLIRIGGCRESRLIFNTIGMHLPFARRWLVS